MKKFITLLCVLACSSGALFAMQGTGNEWGFKRAFGKWWQTIEKATLTQNDVPEKFAQKSEALINAFGEVSGLINLLNDKTKTFDEEFKEGQYDAMCKLLIRTYKRTFVWLLSQGPYKQKNSLMLSKFKELVDIFVLETDKVKDENGSAAPLHSLSIQKAISQITCDKLNASAFNPPAEKLTAQEAMIRVLSVYVDENFEDQVYQEITEDLFENYILPYAKLQAVSEDMDKFDAKIARFLYDVFNGGYKKVSSSEEDMNKISTVFTAFSKALDLVAAQDFTVALDNDAFYLSIDCKTIAENIAPFKFTEEIVEEELAKAMSFQPGVNLFEEEIVFNENDYPEVDQQSVNSQEEVLSESEDESGHEVLSESESEEEEEFVFNENDYPEVGQPIDAHAEDAFGQQMNNGLPQGGVLKQPPVRLTYHFHPFIFWPDPLVRMQAFLVNNWQWAVPVGVVGSVALAFTARYMFKRFFGFPMPISNLPISGQRVIAKQPIRVAAAA